MIFLAAKKECELSVHGAFFSLKPLALPEVDLSQVIVAEGELAKRILDKDEGFLCRADFEAEKIPGFPRRLESVKQVGQGESLLVLRGGGIGDMLMLTPALAELKRRIPASARITLATFESLKPLFESHQHLDDLVTMPMTLGQVLGYDHFFVFKDPEKKMSRMNMTDYYLETLGIDPAGVTDKRPILNEGSLFDRKTASKLGGLKKRFDRLVFLNGLATDPLRDLPLSLLDVLPGNLPETGFFISGRYVKRYKKARDLLKRHTNLFFLNAGSSMKAYVTAISMCDAVVSNDSSAYHIAAALNKRTVVLFGPVEPALRISYYTKAISITPDFRGLSCNGPCGKDKLSDFNDKDALDKKRCPQALARGTEYSPCLESIDPSLLIEAVLAALA